MDDAFQTRRFRDALAYVLDLHGSQRRKGSATPYISHLLAVAAKVMEDTQNEDVVIAALLHDAIEDQGGEATRSEIRERFGARVESLVVGCSDHLGGAKRPWRERKENFIRRLEEADEDALVIIAADKLHNARSVLRDHRARETDIWSIFLGGREGSLWYYRSIQAALSRRLPENATVQELEAAVSRLEKLA